NPDLGSYNLPGGAHGSLVTNAFSLAGYSPGDAPTLYFNYLLGSGAPAGGSATKMTDSVRVFASTDGTNWVEVATNNALLSIGSNAELPSFLSTSITANSTDSKQGVQQLFNTTNWLQARIDLSRFAGKSGIQLRFDFSTSGTSTDGQPGDQTGVGPKDA